MKKTIHTKKLTLNKTTLRKLDESALKGVVGGDSECGSCGCASGGSCICHSGECPPTVIVLRDA